MMLSSRATRVFIERLLPVLAAVLLMLLLQPWSWAAGWLVAHYNGLTLEELVRDRSFSRFVRRIPDYAVVFATFAVLFAVWSAIPSGKRRNI